MARHRDQIRMRQELEVARQMQMGMLPVASPDLRWVEVSAVCVPAMEVGGDYWDYFVLEDGRLVLVIGDVAGKGVPSGLVLAGLRGGLTLLADELDDPLRVLSKLDRMLRQTNRRRTLVTLSLLLFDPREHEVAAVSAGHPPVLLLRRDGAVEELAAHSLPLGVGLERELELERLEVGAGDVLVLYSDGVYEAVDGADDPYGMERLRQTLAACVGSSSAVEIQERILGDLRDHRGTTPQNDDVTLVVVRILE